MLSTEELYTWRCKHCHKILAKLELTPGSYVEVKCGCNFFNTLEYRPAQVQVITTCGNLTGISLLTCSA